MNSDSVKVGLIGLGKMGQNHLRVLSMLKSVDLKFIFDANAEAAKRLSEQYAIPAAQDLEADLRRVDAVVIATPTVTHGAYVRMTAAAGVKHLFVEKPLADTLAESRAVHAFAMEHGLNIQVGFIERFNPAVQQLKKVLDGSSRVISVDFTRTNKLSARITDVDVVTDLMIHDIDLALYINGPVVSVSAHGVREGQMIDFASALLTHANGRFSRIQASRITEKKMRYICATCMDMFVDCELVRKEIVINRQSEIRQQENGPYMVASLQETVEVRPQEALLDELQAFISSVQGHDVDKPGVDAGLAAMKICAQIQQAVLA